MKVYFIFDVKEQFISLYQNNYRVLYNILRQIYYLDREEVNYAYTLFRQLVNTIDKNATFQSFIIKLIRNIIIKAPKNKLSYHCHLFAFFLPFV